MIRVRRVYDPPEAADGLRILVDRLWPRGLAKQAAHLDVWARDLAPSPALRRWFGHDPAHWSEFQRRYRLELQENAAALAALRARIGGGTATLLTATRDAGHSHAHVLEAVLRDSPQP